MFGAHKIETKGETVLGRLPPPRLSVHRLKYTPSLLVTAPLKLGETAICLIYRNKLRKSRKLRKQRTMFQMKEQNKTSEKNFDEREVSNLPDKELKVIVIKLLTNLRITHRGFDKHIEKFRRK